MIGRLSSHRRRQVGGYISSSKRCSCSYRLFLLLQLVALCWITYHVGWLSVQQQNNSYGVFSDNYNYPQKPEVSRSLSLTKLPRAHQIDKSKLPHKCGMVFFFHVPSTGGATIKQWLWEYKTAQNYGTVHNISHFEHWGRTAPFFDIQRGFLGGWDNGTIKLKNGHRVGRHGGMNDFVANMKQDEWKIAHCHHSNMPLNTTEQYLSQWRSTVEGQGCAFIATIMFRDPLSHALSLFKHIKRYKSSKDVWTKHLLSTSEMGDWQTQLDYFLYNFLDRNPVSIYTLRSLVWFIYASYLRHLPNLFFLYMVYPKDGADKDTKVQRALQILHDHFDIITVGEHDRFKKELLSTTGWEERGMRRTNTYKGEELQFSKAEVEEVQQQLDDNGDIDFMYQVKKIYQTS